MTIKDVEGLRTELEKTGENQVAKVETTAETVAPAEGAIYYDAGERELRVDKVDLADPQGSQVKGEVRAPGQKDYTPYSTTLQTWEKVWRDKAQPIAPGKMKIG